MSNRGQRAKNGTRIAGPLKFRDEKGLLSTNQSPKQLTDTKAYIFREIYLNKKS